VCFIYESINATRVNAESSKQLIVPCCGWGYCVSSTICWVSSCRRWRNPRSTNRHCGSELVVHARAQLYRCYHTPSLHHTLPFDRITHKLEKMAISDALPLEVAVPPVVLSFNQETSSADP